MSDGRCSKTWKAPGVLLTCLFPGEGWEGPPSLQRAASAPQAHCTERGPAVSTVPSAPSLSLTDWSSEAEYTEPGWKPSQALHTSDPERVHLPGVCRSLPGLSGPSS